MSGLLLRDSEIVAAIDAGEISVTNIARDENGALPLTDESAVQASSLDLTIGRILVPPDTVAELTDPEPTGETGFQLDPGRTVVVETLEEISLSNKMAAFGFPPSRLSGNSILMTNPGHVDPGFSGHLKFTLINMGRETYSLKYKAQIVSLLIFMFPKSVECGFAARNAGKPIRLSNIPLLNRLSPDFASFSTRMEDSSAKAVAKQLVDFERQTNAAASALGDAEVTLRDAESKFHLSKLWVPALTSLIVALLTLIGTQQIDIFGVASQEDLSSLDDRVSTIETTRDFASAKDLDLLGDRVGTIEATRDIEDIQRQLQDLEESLAPLLEAQSENGG